MSESGAGCAQDTLKSALGKKVESASSSLDSFAIAFQDGKGLLLSAVNREGRGGIDATLVDSSSLPKLAEAVCTVDWSWIEGATVVDAESGTSTLRLILEPTGPLTIGCAFWDGKPFLSFQPYRPAKK